MHVVIDLIQNRLKKLVQNRFTSFLIITHVMSILNENVLTQKYVWASWWQSDNV